MEIVLLMWPLGIFCALYEDSGWKSSLLFLIFCFLFFGGFILMGVDATHGIISPFDPHSTFRTMIPWFHLLLIFLIAITIKALRLAHLQSKKNKAGLKKIA